MYLIAQDQDGTQTAATPNDIRSYSKALTDAENHLRRHPETVALYLWTDNGSNVVRTYVRATKPPYRVAEVLFGLHEWPKPPVLYPVADLAPLYPYQEAGLDRYRAFFADYGELEARAVAHYGGGRNMGKSAALGAPYGLPGSVRAGVRGWSAEESKRPTFTVDLGHNRR